MAKISNIIEQMRTCPQSVRFRDLCRVCDEYFGQARQQGSSHRVYRVPWQGDPRVNIQESKGLAKPYQVRQVLKAIDRMEAENEQRH